MTEVQDEVFQRHLTVTQFLDVRPLGGGEYRARNLWMSQMMRAVYGGQVMGQALMAATKSIFDLHPSFLLHSFHCYFVGPMQVTPDVVYRVSVVKEGRNFCSVSVEAVQNQKVCFHCLASFQKPEALEADLNYCSHLMPTVPHPNDKDSIFTQESKDRFNVDLRKGLFRLQSEFDRTSFSLDWYCCLDYKDAKKIWASESIPPKIPTWMRGLNTFKATKHQNYHRVALAYSSDFMMSSLVLYMYPKFKVGLETSLDHSMWFHAPVDSNKWYLHDYELKDAINGQTLNSSRIFNEDGQVVATCTQEALIRPKL